MANSFTIELDATKLREALEGESLRDVIKAFVKAASRPSADNIAREAAARLDRQLSGRSSGLTVASIVVRPTRDGLGWVVDAGNVRMPMLDRWLESGTVKMRARPFFWASVRLEEQAHFDRVQAAVQAALSEYGLGPEQA